MKVIGNILWFLFTGFWTGLMWFFTGILWCITLIGIPFGLRAFKFAKLSICPFGATIESAKELAEAAKAAKAAESAEA